MSKTVYDLAHCYVQRYEESHDNYTIGLMKEAYMTAYNYGRNLSEREIADYIWKLNKERRADHRNTIIIVALLCLWLGYKIGMK